MRKALTNQPEASVSPFLKVRGTDVLCTGGRSEEAVMKES